MLAEQLSTVTSRDLKILVLRRVEHGLFCMSSYGSEGTVGVLLIPLFNNHYIQNYNVKKRSMREHAKILPYLSIRQHISEELVIELKSVTAEVTG